MGGGNREQGSTDAILEQLGSPKELEKFILNLHRGAESWPGEMDLATGWFTKGKKKRLKPGMGQSVEIEDVDVVEVIEKICGITGIRVIDYDKVFEAQRATLNDDLQYGRCIEPLNLTHSSIGKELGITSTHVAMDLKRGCSKIPEFSKWEEEWEVYLST